MPKFCVVNSLGSFTDLVYVKELLFMLLLNIACNFNRGGSSQKCIVLI